MELPGGYGKEAVQEIIGRAKAALEEDYGFIDVPPALYDRLCDECRVMAKGYDAEIAYEEIQREILAFIKHDSLGRNHP